MNYNNYEMYLMNNYYGYNNGYELGSLEDGFYKGNIFENEYIPYKNYGVPKPEITNDREGLLEQIQMYSFIAHDINLYLDTHPNDKDYISLYNKYEGEAKKLEDEYVKRYGPLKLSESLNKFPWEWLEKPWPWND